MDSLEKRADSLPQVIGPTVARERLASMNRWMQRDPQTNALVSAEVMILVVLLSVHLAFLGVVPLLRTVDH